MKNDIFESLHCAQTVFDIEAETRGNVTWIVPTQEKNRHYVDLIAETENLIRDFMILGSYLEHLLTEDEYNPLYLEDYIVARLNKYHNRQTAIDDQQSPFDDQQSPFLSKDYDGVVYRVLAFFSKYGLPDSRNVPNTVLRLTIPAVSKSVFATTKLHQCRWPLSALVYIIFEIYMKYNKTQKYLGLWHKTPPTYIKSNHPERFSISLTLSVTYNINGSWEEKKSCNNLFDYLILFLFYNDMIYVRECPYCKKIYITRNERSVYCDSVCRNRANAKNSYDRKKKMKVINNGQEE